jgi:hypothetical protein
MDGHDDEGLGYLWGFHRLFLFYGTFPFYQSLYVRNPKTWRTNQFSGTELQVLGSMITEGCNELRDWVDSWNYWKRNITTNVENEIAELKLAIDLLH